MSKYLLQISFMSDMILYWNTLRGRVCVRVYFCLTSSHFDAWCYQSLLMICIIISIIRMGCSKMYVIFYFILYKQNFYFILPISTRICSALECIFVLYKYKYISIRNVFDFWKVQNRGRRTGQRKNSTDNRITFWFKWNGTINWNIEMDQLFTLFFVLKINVVCYK